MYGDRPRVTPHEFQHYVRPELLNKGFTEHQINQVETAFHESLAGNPHLPSWKPGVDAENLAQTMQYMRAHPGATMVGPHHWDAVNEVMEKYIHERH
ncbi:MAG TPA: hypothetical protein VHC68_01395 [Candidatus Paceibacterota bacterium]|nr:hypothetical protein [Candidatus Paceibacterota bacterium]